MEVLQMWKVPTGNVTFPLPSTNAAWPTEFLHTLYFAVNLIPHCVWFFSIRPLGSYGKAWRGLGRESESLKLKAHLLNCSLITFGDGNGRMKISMRVVALDVSQKAVARKGFGKIWGNGKVKCSLTGSKSWDNKWMWLGINQATVCRILNSLFVRHEMEWWYLEETYFNQDEAWERLGWKEK